MGLYGRRWVGQVLGDIKKRGRRWQEIRWGRLKEDGR
jgi:hypothetical protein